MLPTCGDGVVDEGEECDGGEDCTEECEALGSASSSASSEAGCGCNSAEGGFRPPVEALLVVFGLALWRRRRRS